MIKKAIVAGGAVALLSSLAIGLPFSSYTRCGVSWLRESAHDAMPLEWELKRARQMVHDLRPEISQNAKRIARERIEVARLAQQLEETETQLATAEQNIKRLSGDLREGDTHFTYAGRSYTSVQVKEDLKNRFKRFKTQQATADKLQQMLSARQASLGSAEQRMEELLNARRQLEVEVENLQARVGALRVAQTASEFSVDDSHLSHTRQLLDEISVRIQEEEETLAVDQEYFGGINLEEPSDENLLDDIASYFDDRAEQGEESEELVAIQLD